jgi:hypothetical protein
MFDLASCAIAREFLQSPFGLDGISQKFQNGLREEYREINITDFCSAAESMLFTLNEADAGEDSVEILESFYFFRLHFEMDKTPRKLSGLFSSSLKGDKDCRYSADNTRKKFKAFLFGLRNGAMPLQPSTWSIASDNTIPLLSQQIGQKASVLDSL